MPTDHNAYLHKYSALICPILEASVYTSLTKIITLFKLHIVKYKNAKYVPPPMDFPFLTFVYPFCCNADSMEEYDCMIVKEKGKWKQVTICKLLRSGDLEICIGDSIDLLYCRQLNLQYKSYDKDPDLVDFDLQFEISNTSRYEFIYFTHSSVKWRTFGFRTCSGREY